MGADHLIDEREVLQVTPPDILLTNYKMLDFLLLRRADHELWAEANAAIPGARRVPHLRRRAGHRRRDAAAAARPNPEGRWGEWTARQRHSGRDLGHARSGAYVDARAT